MPYASYVSADPVDFAERDEKVIQLKFADNAADEDKETVSRNGGIGRTVVVRVGTTAQSGRDKCLQGIGPWRNDGDAEC